MVAPPVTLSPVEPVAIKIVFAGDFPRASAAARNMAAAVGFAPAEAEEIALVVMELASNLVRHAGRGIINVSTVLAEDRKGVQIESLDDGPGIQDVELALTDGFSTGGGLGNGLGTVNRLMDQLEFHHRPNLGSRIVCRRWIRPNSGHHLLGRLDCGAATRPCRTASDNGDAFVIRQWDDRALVGVIDGLGHGRLAFKAAQTARAYVEHHFDQPLPDLFRGVGRACRATRGVVMSLARFELVQSSLSVAGIGNVEVRLVGTAVPSHLVIRRGVLGGHSPEPLIKSYPWHAGAVLVIHSDGLKNQLDWQDYACLSGVPAAVIARQLLQDLSRPEDDATVVVARNAVA
jgi:anti-sigma regulatory factor (Ser/Thr protein kinase)/serine/threonine protein phosphatase PrpC